MGANFFYYSIYDRFIQRQPCACMRACILVCICYFLAPLAVGQQAYVMVRCPSCGRASVHALTFSLNIFFSETTYWISMKFHRNVPTMVLFRIY